MAQTCIVCGNKIGMTGNRLGKDRWMCATCLKQAGGVLKFNGLKAMSDEEIKEMVESNGGISEPKKAGVLAEALTEAAESIAPYVDERQIALKNEFSETHKIGKFMIIDENAKLIYFPVTSLRGALAPNALGAAAGYYASYDDIIAYELLENGTSVTKGGLGAAIAGGALFGGFGAVTGGVIGKKKTVTVCHSLYVKVTLNDMSRSALFIDLLQAKVKNNSLAYKNAMETAQQMLSALQLICEENGKLNDAGTNDVSVADEIKKYKELLDVGAITEEEYEQKKKQLLGL